LQQWRIVFISSALIFTIANLFYVAFGTAVEQPWNKMQLLNANEMRTVPATSTNDDEIDQTSDLPQRG